MDMMALQETLADVLPPLRITILLSFLLGFQVPTSSAQLDGVHLPQPKVKTPEPRTAAPTLVSVVDQELWGLRLWQVAGLSLSATIILITFCCCVCDCRIPKTGYDKQEPKPVHDSDDEPGTVSKPHPKRKNLAFANGASDSFPHGSQLWNTQRPNSFSGRRLGEENWAFDSHEGILVSHNHPRNPPGMTCLQP